MNPESERDQHLAKSPEKRPQDDTEKNKCNKKGCTLHIQSEALDRNQEPIILEVPEAIRRGLPELKRFDPSEVEARLRRSPSDEIPGLTKEQFTLLLQAVDSQIAVLSTRIDAQLEAFFEPLRQNLKQTAEIQTMFTDAQNEVSRKTHKYAQALKAGFTELHEHLHGKCQPDKTP